jgi:hypothetical protein
MSTRTRRKKVLFGNPFRIKGVDRILPPGEYEVVIDEEQIDSLSFPVFRRVATMIMVPGAPPRHSSTGMISTSSEELASAQRSVAGMRRD